MSPNKRSSRRKIKKSPFLGLFSLAALICISLAATVYLIFLRPGTHPQLEEKTPAYFEEVPPPKAPKPFTEPKATDTVEQPAAPEQAKKSAQNIQPKGPQIAIIIDDIGHNRKMAEKFIDFDINLNFSILPHSPYGLKLAKKAQSKGRDILLHLPMEPTDPKWDPGPGALFLKMDKKTMQTTLAKNLQAVPMAIGINNHMGSRYSENTEAMTDFFTELKPKNLFFIDSLTSSKSIGYSLAQRMSVKTAKRNIFLDNDKDTEKILKQLNRLITIAQKHGKAIGIGHPYPETLAALTKALPLLRQEVVVTSIHALVE